MTLFIGSLQLGFIYALLALGIYITFRILNVPDLTADGSFTLGLSVSAICTVSGHPILGIFLAIIAGMIAGSFTGILQTKFKIHPILSGILTMGGLYSINLLVLGNRSNISLIGTENIFGLLGNMDKDIAKLIISVVICLFFVTILILFINTHIGLCIRATGDNEDMVCASSIDVELIKIIALAVANGFVALSGAVIAQYQGFADIGSGTGIVTVGLASVIIGEVFFGKKTIKIGILGAVFGSVLYRIIIAIALQNDIFPTYMLKLVSSLIVVVALSIPVLKENMKIRKIKKEAMLDA